MSIVIVIRQPRNRAVAVKISLPWLPCHGADDWEGPCVVKRATGEIFPVYKMVDDTQAAFITSCITDLSFSFSYSGEGGEEGGEGEERFMALGPPCSVLPLPFAIRC